MFSGELVILSIVVNSLMDSCVIGEWLVMVRVWWDWKFFVFFELLFRLK